MITRFMVTGFKNLVGVDVRFGPFTCITGANGVGKSNLFDAIVFVSRLANASLLEAASYVRDPDGRASEVRSLFTRSGESYAETMRFGVEMVVPPEATDDLGQRAEAIITTLRYELELAYEEGDQVSHPDRLVIRHEALIHLKRGQIKEVLPFLLDPSRGRSMGWGDSSEWRERAVFGKRNSPFLSTTESEHGKVIIQRHQDGNAGRTQQFDAANLPRTVLSTTNARESPTALVARREMESWSLLHFEPSALRRPDDVRGGVRRMASDGGHLPATLYRLANQGPVSPEVVYSRVANRLADLIEDVRNVRVERDTKRELLTLQVEDREGTRHAARSLSDGTLRFLALTVLQEDPEASGVWCLEEPENGLYPARAPAMIALLRDLAMDTDFEISPDNPLRQVIINTHSPGVVQEIESDSLVAAIPVEALVNGHPVQTIRFKALDSTWRTDLASPAAEPISKGWLLSYLNGSANFQDSGDGSNGHVGRRVIDRPDVRQMMFHFPDNK